MKQIKFISAFFGVVLSTAAMANINANNGFYIGAGLNSSAYIPPDGASFDASIFPITAYLRPLIGYRFTDYLAIEGGFNNIQNQSHSGGQIESSTNGVEDSPILLGPDHYRLYSFDLAAKGILPFENGFSVFGKAGAALTHQDAFNQTYLDGPVNIDSTTNQIQPLLGAGVSYNFTKNVAADLTFTHLFSRGNISDINTLGLEISYTFGNDA